MPLPAEWDIKTSGNDLCLQAFAPVQDHDARPKNMENNMKSLSLSRWFTLGALVLTIGGTFSRSANGQTQAAQSADQSNAAPAVGQQLLTAKADAAPFVNLTAVASLATAPTTSVPVPPPPSSSFTWTGFYFGANIGHGSVDGDTAVNPLPSAATFVNLLPQTLNLDPTGILGGGQIGYNWQHGHFVVGVEADIDATDVEATNFVTPITQNNNTPFPGAGNHIIVEQRMDAFSTVRPRFGFTLGSRFLGTADNLPSSRKMMIKMGVIFTRLANGLRLSDSHNGFRAFSRRALAERSVLTSSGSSSARPMVWRGLSEP